MPLSFAVRTGDAATVSTPLLAVLLGSGRELPRGLRALDAALGGSLERVISRGDFRGGRDETLHVLGNETGPARILVVGVGQG